MQVSNLISEQLRGHRLGLEAITQKEKKIKTQNEEETIGNL